MGRRISIECGFRSFEQAGCSRPALGLPDMHSQNFRRIRRESPITARRERIWTVEAALR